MNWITHALKKALSSGDMAVVSSLQDEIKGIELSVLTKVSPKSVLIVTRGTDFAKPTKAKQKHTKKSETPIPSVESLTISNGDS